MVFLGEFHLIAYYLLDDLSSRLNIIFRCRTFGEGKRRKEFAEWYVEWRAEWHNYAKYDLRGE